VRRALAVALVSASILVSMPAAHAATWTFENIGTNPVAGSPGIGRKQVAVAYNNQQHLFYSDEANGDLKHYWRSADGRSGGNAAMDGDGNQNGKTYNNVTGATPAVTLVRGVPFVFYQDKTWGELRYAKLVDPVYNRWDAYRLAGDGPGPVTLGSSIAAVTYQDQPHVFYNVDSQLPCATCPRTSTGSVGHAWMTSDNRWHFDTVEPGTFSLQVGINLTAVIYNGVPHVFHGGYYYVSGTKTLRHAWWGGSGWGNETLDGTGCHPTPSSCPAGTQGRTTNNVGFVSSAVVANGVPNVFYSDDTQTDLRRAWYAGSRWNFETLDGHSTVGGRRTGASNVAIKAVVWRGRPDVFYSDSSCGVLRHAWLSGSWGFEDLDGGYLGWPGYNRYPGNTDHSVGCGSAPVVLGTVLHNYSHDKTVGNIRHTTYA
jgi:hypothetical protein